MGMVAMLAEDALALFLARERGEDPVVARPVLPDYGVPEGLARDLARVGELSRVGTKAQADMTSLAGLPPETFAALMADFPFAFHVGQNLNLTT